MLLVQHGPLQEIGPTLQCPLQALAATPRADCRMVAGEQHCRHLLAVVYLGAGVVRAVQQAGLEAFRQSLVRIVPFLDGRVHEIDSWDKVKLLTVQVNHLERWSSPGLLCIGDAAHAMYPNGSNGASQAIIDGRTLALKLATADSIIDALREYDEERRVATTALLLSTRQTGPERVMLLARERAPQGFDRISEVFAEGELAEIASAYKRAAGFDPELLNNRPSLSAAGARW